MISLISGSSEDDEAVVSKYKALLSDIKEKQKKTDLETDMEVSFMLSLKRLVTLCKLFSILASEQCH